jgi:glycosyltransferase involved in cell wall biosynthesis
VHQFVSSFVVRDAQSAHTLRVRDLLRDMGFDSRIYVRETRGALAAESEHYRAFAPGPGPTYLLYQASTGSVLADFVAQRPEPVIVNYHNVTPPAFFEAWEPHVAVELDVGLRQMAELAPRTVLGICVSAFNERDLRGLGVERTAVAPVLLDLDALDSEPDPATHERLVRAKDAGGADLLFVGRLSPNKAQHDLVKALAAYRRLYDPAARLRLVGGPASPAYERALRGFVAALDLDDVVDIAGSLSEAEMLAYYRTADAFVCVSEHEGFCIPLVEAMHHGVPVVAFDAGAVSETVAGGGLVLHEKHPGLVAAAVDRVVGDPVFAERLVAAGHRRAAEFSLENTRARFATAIRQVVIAA